MVILTALDVNSCCLRCFKPKDVYRPSTYATSEKISEGRFLIEKYRKEKHLPGIDDSLLDDQNKNWDNTNEVNTSVTSDIRIEQNNSKVDDI